MAEESVDHFRRYFESLRGTEHAKNTLINKLLTKLADLEESYQAMEMDYDREMRYNRQGQLKEKQMAQQIKDLQNEMFRDPFVLVLLDGDGMIFNDNALQKGEAGGKDAASELWNHIREYVHKHQPDIPSHFKIMVRVYANLRGLGDAAYRAGIINAPTVMENFARGFTGGKQLFDFVDVGGGKERADQKIQEQLKLYLYNCSCQHVIFGGSHDNGYARLLEEIPQASRSKVTLLEGVPFERELRTLTTDYETTKFSDLFRHDKVALPFYAPVVRTIGSDVESTKPFANGNLDANGYPTPKPSPHATYARPGTGNTWAGTVMLAPSPPPEVVMPPQQSHDPTGIARNKYGQRLDSPIPTPDPAERFRVGKMKMCNIYYLQNACPYGDTCTHMHSIEPTKSEMDVLRYINRSIPCRNGTLCDEPSCIYGHRCPRSVEVQGQGGHGSICRFPTDMHGIDMRAVKTITV